METSCMVANVGLSVVIMVCCFWMSKCSLQLVNQVVHEREQDFQLSVESVGQDERGICKDLGNMSLLSQWPCVGTSGT